MITSATGTIQEQMDFYPFGGVAYTSGSDTNHFKFTGKERDSESGFDNFGARYFESNVGRFMTPDWAARPTAVPYAVFGDPQSLNLYIYVRNDPVTRADADGHQDPPQSPITPDHENPECRYEHCHDTPPAQNTSSTVSTQEVVQNTTTGAVVGGVAGAIVGGIAGGAGGTLVEPGGGTLVGIGLGGTEGAKDGAVAGAVVGATAGVVYTESKDALNKVGKHIETALEHLGKLANSPDQNPRNKWKETVRKSADNIDKQSNRIANQHLSNAGHWVADMLRGLVD